MCVGYNGVTITIYVFFPICVTIHHKPSTVLPNLQSAKLRQIAASDLKVAQSLSSRPNHMPNFQNLGAFEP